MDLQDIFPDDPLEPTIKYVGANQTPFSVPWAKGRVRLCTGFNSQRGQHDDLFMSSSAFQDVNSSPLKYRQCQITAIRDESGSSIANSSEDKSFAISASVGGSFLGVSARGSYEKSVRDNRNNSNISVRADHICGQVEILHLPQLTKDAVWLLNTSSDPINHFRARYGDFYVAGYRIGAVNNTMISGDLANKTFFEAKRAEVKVKLLFSTISKSVNEVSESANDEGGISVTAFDSLTSFYSSFMARTHEDSIRVGEVAAENKQRAMNIAARAAETLWNEFSFGYEATLHQDVADQLCDRGLVTELLLAPFSALREYQYLLARRASLH
ncbi:hypothetical protein FMEXI_8923 [Fusarium mexicanum]|uniref:Uncharacterized protein n=1 Tax=Fusarium mexicanum TaxID=751941 RepID=A0A8H5IM81_9HYPO|nr:hypothetical protein FMEXI_8923 [Fusarium mexicanum]